MASEGKIFGFDGWTAPERDGEDAGGCFGAGVLFLRTRRRTIAQLGVPIIGVKVFGLNLRLVGRFRVGRLSRGVGTFGCAYCDGRLYAFIGSHPRTFAWC